MAFLSTESGREPSARAGGLWALSGLPSHALGASPSPQQACGRVDTLQRGAFAGGRTTRASPPVALRMVKTSPPGLVVGIKVILHSLENDKEYNRCSATVVALDGDKASVRLDSGPERGRRLKVPHRFLAVDVEGNYVEGCVQGILAPGSRPRQPACQYDQYVEGEDENAAI